MVQFFFDSQCTFAVYIVQSFASIYLYHTHMYVHKLEFLCLLLPEQFCKTFTQYGQ